VQQDKFAQAVEDLRQAFLLSEIDFSVAGSIDLKAQDATRLILGRLAAYERLDTYIKTRVQKHLRGSLDHVMVETIAFFLRSYLKQNGVTTLDVHAEKTLQSKRPDISIWKGQKAIASIEAKVQMGWGRSTVDVGFRKREQELLARGIPIDNQFTVVATQVNWERSNAPEWGNRWLVLTEGGLSEDPQIVHAIESTFLHILNLK
jgi:hypothetical protein